MVSDCTKFWFFCKAHSSVHIEICTGKCNAVNRLKDKKDGTVISCRDLYSVFYFNKKYMQKGLSASNLLKIELTGKADYEKSTLAG